jgi:hypothetical protein
MILGFLIATLVLFIANIILNLILLGVVVTEGDNRRATTIALTVLIYLIILTWNIFAIISL